MIGSAAMGDRSDGRRSGDLKAWAKRPAHLRGKPPPELLGWGLEQSARIGHNNGPPLDDDAPGYVWRRYRWTKAHAAVWKTPSMTVVKFRVARAAAAGLTYHAYMSTLLDTGRSAQASDGDVARAAALKRFRDAWNTTLARLAPASSRIDRGIVLSSLIAAYDEPRRAYHTLVHIGAMLADLDRFGSALAGTEADAVRLAVLFHDAVYDPTRTDNEDASARLASLQLGSLGVDAALVARVADLVRATQHGVAPPADATAALLVDIDLAVLAADSARYDAYAAAIRREYTHVPDDAFRTGRRRVLDGFRARRFIYATPALRSLFEQRARENLARECDQLTVTPPR